MVFNHVSKWHPHTWDFFFPFLNIITSKKFIHYVLYFWGWLIIPTLMLKIINITDMLFSYPKSRKTIYIFWYIIKAHMSNKTSSHFVRKSFVGQNIRNIKLNEWFFGVWSPPPHQYIWNWIAPISLLHSKLITIKLSFWMGNRA